MALLSPIVKSLLLDGLSGWSKEAMDEHLKIPSPFVSLPLAFFSLCPPFWSQPCHPGKWQILEIFVMGTTPATVLFHEELIPSHGEEQRR